MGKRYTCLAKSKIFALVKGVKDYVMWFDEDDYQVRFYQNFLHHYFFRTKNLKLTYYAFCITQI